MRVDAVPLEENQCKQQVVFAGIFVFVSVSMTMRATFSPLCLQAHTQLTRVHTQPGSAHKDVLTYVHVRPAHTCMHRASSLCFPFPFEGRFPGLQALLASPKQQ